MLRAILLLLVFIAVPARAQNSLQGHWALLDGDTILMRLDVALKAEDCQATLLRPAVVSFTGEVMEIEAGSLLSLQSDAAAAIRDGLSFQFERRDGSQFEICILTAGQSGAALEIPGALADRVHLSRLDQPDELQSFREGVYKLPLWRPTNAEMTSIFMADQADRADSANIDWAVVAPRDAERLQRTEALLDEGQLRSGDDYWHAAYIFQHGGTAQDHLKAHLLATVAVARGKPEGLWIASASLDRYLQNIGQPQVLGTQFITPETGTTTQEPYDRNLVSDALRVALGVPALVVQEQQRRELDRQRKQP
jgi:hypothetical protein